MRLKEWKEPCEWCGVNPGEPCKTEDGKTYSTHVHIPRSRLWEKKEVKRLVENRPELLPPKPRYAKGPSGLRSSGGTKT